MAALATLRDLAHRHSALDDERAAHLIAIAAAHPGIPVLACTQYAATVDALWRRLRLRPGVAALTSRGARIASGPIDRTQALERFAPVAQRAREPHARERIHLLVTTDLVSEGLNLHDAGVVVHLDLPWTAARLAQRVGRVARLGSPHALVHTHTISPPHAAATLLALERRVRTKRRIASRLVGGGARLSELLGGAPGGTGAPEAQARILAMLAPHAGPRADVHDAVVCVARAPCDGWLALVSTSGGTRFVIRLRRSPPTTDPRVVVRGIEWLVACDEQSLATDWHRAAREAERWCASDRARRLSGAGRRHAARELGRSLAATIGTVGSSAPHDRARAAGAASEQMRELASHARADGPERLVALVVFCTNAEAPDRPPV